MPARKKRRLGMGLSGMIANPVEVDPSPSPGTTDGDAGDPGPDTAQKRGRTKGGTQPDTARKRRRRKSAPDPATADASPNGAGRPPSADPTAHGDATSATPSEHAPPADTAIAYLAIDQVIPNTRQPRQHIDDRALEPLVASITTAGIMQPIIVRPQGSRYELVAGERRWRAAEKAGLATVPAIIRDVDDRTAAEWAIIENVQREDLDPIDKAQAYKRLQDEFGLTHAEIAEHVGLTRSGVSNQIRLCDLDSGTCALIRNGAMTGGHGRCLLAISSIDDRLALAKQAVTAEWSVRELERRVRAATSTTSAPTPTPSTSRAHLDDLEAQLGKHLGTRVHIRTGRAKGTGRIVIEFYDHAQFDGLIGHMGFTPAG